MTAQRPLQAILSVEPTGSAAPPTRALWEALAAGGVSLAQPPERAAAGAGQVPLILFDGKLKPEHGQLLRDALPRFLLACTGPELTPRSDHIRVLSSMLAGAPLTPDHDGVQRYYVGTLEGLRGISERVSLHLESLDAPKSAVQACADVMYELAANALLDAPCDPDGKPRYAHRRDDPELRISPEDAAVIAFGVKGSSAFLGVVDRFGRLGPEPLARTVEGLGARAKVNDSGGGAGLGLRRIVEQSDLVAVRVVPGRVTEVLCTVELKEIRRRAAAPKSVFFTVERG